MNRLFWLSCTLLLSSASVSFADQSPRFFVSYDQFFDGDLDENTSQMERDGRLIILSQGGIPGETTVETTGVRGIRAGVLRPLGQGAFFGASVGYLTGGELNTRIYDIAPPVGFLEERIEVEYLRVLLEGAKYFPLDDRLAFKLGAGIGFGRGRTEQRLVGGGSWIVTANEHTEDSTGVTFEISPAVVIRLASLDVEIGARYAQFPKIKESDFTYEIDYNALGFFAGIAF